MKGLYTISCQTILTISLMSLVLRGFRKAHSTQHALFKLIQSWQKSLHCGRFAETILMDLSKVYDCIRH